MRTFGVLNLIGIAGAYRISQEPEAVEKEPEKKVVDVPWSYAVHGSDWTGDKNGFCKEPAAKFQSPVDLGQGEDVFDDVNMLFYNYPRLAEPLKLYNDGKTISATLPAHYKGGFGYGKLPRLDQYRLMQFTFHAPSEHTLNGVRQPLELQLTHAKRGSDRLGITSIFFASNAAGPTGGVPFLDVLVHEGLPEEEWGEVMTNLAAPAKGFHEKPGMSAYNGTKDIRFEQAFEPLQGPNSGMEPKPVQFYRYDGSLTVPPCTQNVDWFVRKEPVRVAKETIDLLTSSLRKIGGTDGNYREIQMGNFGTGSAERTTPVLITADSYGNKFNYAIPDGPAPVPPAPPVTSEEIGLNKDIYETIFGDETPAQVGEI